MSNELNKLFEIADKSLDDLFAEAEAEKIRKLKIEQDKEDELLHSLQQYLAGFIPQAALPYARYYPYQKKLREDAASGHMIFFIFPDAYPIGLYVWQHQFTQEWHVDGMYGIYASIEDMIYKWRADSFLVALGASRRHYQEDMKLVDTVTNQV